MKQGAKCEWESQMLRRAQNFEKERKMWQGSSNIQNISIASERKMVKQNLSGSVA